MRILWVASGQLLPTDSGGRIRTVRTVEQLGRRHDVFLLNFYFRRERDEEHEALFRATFPNSEVTWLGWARRSLVRRALGLLSLRSSMMRPMASRPARTSVSTLLSSGRFDVAICDFLYVASAFPKHPPIPCVLHEHNVEAACRRTEASRRRSLVGRLAVRLDAWRVARDESQAVARFAYTTAVSPGDAEELRAMSRGRGLVTAISTGVDTEEFAAAPLPGGDSPLVVFVGLMSHFPNQDAAAWFVREIWPSVRQRVPTARFRIVGRNPPAPVVALRSESVEVSGGVESVVEHLHEAAVVVVPLRHGSGTRIKIYEAMATGRPVVSTMLGAAGLDVHPGADIVIADDALAMADEVVKLLHSPAWAARIAKEAERTAAQRDWQSVALEIERVLEAAIATMRA